jgi:hypothetical protein
MTPRQMKVAIAAIKKHKNAIAKHRDALNKILSGLEDVLDSSDQGVRELECAIDTLSQYL